MYWRSKLIVLVMAVALGVAGQPQALWIERKPLTVPAAVPAVDRLERLALELRGIQAPEGKGAILRVFLELPEADQTTSVQDPHFVGYVTLVPHGQVQRQKPRNVILPLPKGWAAWLGGRRKARITLVPYPPGKDAHVRIESVLLTKGADE